MAGTALDDLNFGVGNQLQNIPRLQADVLHAQMARHLVGNLAQRRAKTGIQLARLVAQHQVFERIKGCISYLDDVRIVREHQRQFLLEH